MEAVDPNTTLRCGRITSWGWRILKLQRRRFLLHNQVPHVLLFCPCQKVGWVHLSLVKGTCHRTLFKLFAKCDNDPQKFIKEHSITNTKEREMEVGVFFKFVTEEDLKDKSENLCLRCSYYDILDYATPY